MHVLPGSPPRHSFDTQMPLSQSVSSSQPCPTADVKHTPSVQCRPLPQSPSSTHDAPALPLTQTPVASVVFVMRQKPEAQLSLNLHASFSRPPAQRLPVHLPYLQSSSA